jgi:hypothetical protein
VTSILCRDFTRKDKRQVAFIPLLIPTRDKLLAIISGKKTVRVRALVMVSAGRVYLWGAIEQKYGDPAGAYVGAFP